jgi:uncharacterized protein
METSRIKVEVVEAHDKHVSREALELPQGALVRDALAMCATARARGVLAAMQTTDHVADSNVGIWGRRVLLNAKLASGDRIELYRAVTADAKTARLMRAREQGYRWQGRTRRAAKG